MGGSTTSPWYFAFAFGYAARCASFIFFRFSPGSLLHASRHFAQSPLRQGLRSADSAVALRCTCGSSRGARARRSAPWLCRSSSTGRCPAAAHSTGYLAAQRPAQSETEVFRGISPCQRYVRARSLHVPQSTSAAASEEHEDRVLRGSWRPSVARPRNSGQESHGLRAFRMLELDHHLGLGADSPFPAQRLLALAPGKALKTPLAL